MLCKYFQKETMHDLLVECTRLYLKPGCGAGGLLHILLDDDNFDTDSINFCLEACRAHPERPESKLGEEICLKYLEFTLEERAAFDSYWCGQDMQCPECDNCEGCDILGELYSDFKERENE